MNYRTLLLCIGLAQPLAIVAATPAPAEPSAPAPGILYQSAFENYRAYRDEPLADWRTVNDEVSRVGGHVGILRSAGAKPEHDATAPAVEREPPEHGAGTTSSAHGH